MDDPRKEIEAFLTDISGGGMRLVADQELPADQMICVEVGQHLVLADVRRTVPRGSRFVIGAEKVHTLNLLTLPENMGRLDQIQALVDDYHLRIQFALESNANKDSIPTSEVVTRPLESLDPAEELEGPAEPVAAPPAIPRSIPLKEEIRALAAQLPTRPTADTVASAPEQLGLAARRAAAERLPEPNLTRKTTAGPKPHIEPVIEGAANASDQVADHASDGGAPGLAPPMPSNPAPAVAPPPHLNLPVEVDFGQFRVTLPQTQGIESAQGETPAPQLALEVPAAPEAAEPSQSPIGPIWLAPPQSEKKEGEWDDLRAAALQQQFTPETQPEPQPHPTSRRRMAAVAGALVSAVALIALFFGPIRKNALLLSPFAAASEKTVKKGPAAPKLDLVMHVDSAVPPVTPMTDGKTPEKTAETVQVAEVKQPIAISTTAPATNSNAAAKPALPPAQVNMAKPVPLPVDSGGRVHGATIKTTADSWISACVDGKALTGDLLRAGNELEIEFARQAQVVVGNAGGVEMELEGKPLGSLGPDGKSRFVELTPSGFRVLAAGALDDCGKK